LFVKRDDLSNHVYGGNKVRTLEVLFASAVEQGKTTITAVGAFGSNHTVATCLLAANSGLRPQVIAFPQPPSKAAADNLRVVLGCVRPLVLAHWSLLPWATYRYRKRYPGALVMPPGGACPKGAMGYVSAALELAEQVRDGQLP
jgi:D-cysteine desulfhydrase